MRYLTVISLILLPQLAPALGAASAISDHNAFGVERRNILSDLEEEKAKLLKAVGQGVKDIGQGIKHVEGEILETFTPAPDADAPHGVFDENGDIIPTCAKEDCKNSHFMNEAMRWVKQALKDVGVVMMDHPIATTVLIIGVSVLVIELISGGVIVPAMLEVVGFGAKGPIKNTLATAMQRVINPVKLGSTFSQLQSAAMGGQAIAQLTQLAHTLIAGLIAAGAIGLIGGSVKPHGHSASLREWETWELESRVDILADFTSHVTHLWGTPRYAGCAAYGYQDVRAPLSIIPEDMDPLAVCAQTPALINGFGFKTPFRCVNEGSEKGIIGTWYVPTNTTQCMPQWAVFEDEGCMFYGQRRKFARLMGLKSGDDWKSVCASTPAMIDNKHYDRPSYCDDKGVLGIFGVFNIEDKQCECACTHS